MEFKQSLEKGLFNVKNFFKKNFKWNKLAILPIVIMLILGILFIYHWLSLGNPDAFNPLIEDVKNGIGDTSYLFTPQNNISITFMTITFFYCLILTLDLLIRKSSSHISLVVIGLIIVLAYIIAKLTWLTSWNGIRKNSAITFMSIALVAVVGCFYTMVKKALDGDQDWVYHAVFIVGVLFLYFASVNSASVLDLYTHKGDVVFWNDWGSAHCMVLLLLVLADVNLHSDYDPDPIDVVDTHVDLKNNSSASK